MNGDSADLTFEKIAAMRPEKPIIYYMVSEKIGIDGNMILNMQNPNRIWVMGNQAQINMMAEDLTDVVELRPIAEARN